MVTQVFSFNNILTVSVYNQSNERFNERNLNVLQAYYEIDENDVKTKLKPFDLFIYMYGVACADYSFTQSVWNNTQGDYITHTKLGCSIDESGAAVFQIPDDGQESAYTSLNEAANNFVTINGEAQNPSTIGEFNFQMSFSNHVAVKYEKDYIQRKILQSDKISLGGSTGLYQDFELQHHYISGKPKLWDSMVSAAEKFYYYLQLEQDELVLRPSSRRGGISLGFHVSRYTKVSDLDFKPFSAIVSEIGGYIGILYIVMQPLIWLSNFSSFQNLQVKLADQ